MGEELRCKTSVLSYLVIKNITHAKAQRRKALPRFQGFLCAFAPLRENISHIT
jgi:hypothetical protein